MIVVHRIALDPNVAQETLLRKSAGAARFAYNWALREWQEQYRAGGKPSEVALRRQLNAIKREEFPWMLEVSKSVVQQAIKNLGAAFSRFFDNVAARKQEAEVARREGRRPRKIKLGYPRFKKKGRCRDSFRADNGPQDAHSDTVRVDGKHIALPVIGRVRMRERLRFCGRVKSAVVSRTANRWFVALSVEVPDEVRPRKSHAVVGVDLGIRTLATVSDGRDPYSSPAAMKKLGKRRRRLGRALSHKQKFSANFAKAARRLARLEARIANIRADATHKATTDLVRTCSHIVLENLSVRGMMANRKLAGAITDAAFYEFRRQIEYKAKLHGTRVEFAPRFFPSSKMCSKCGYINESLTLKDREWTCSACGTRHDRDFNAAVNLRNLAGSTPVAACGAASAGPSRKRRTKLAAVKQEPTTAIKSH